MEDSGAILNQISALKSMLDSVNEEIEASIQVTREIESGIVRCSEFENSLLLRESESRKMVYLLEYEINGLMTVTSDARTSVKLLEENLSSAKLWQIEIQKTTNADREKFTKSCLSFQRKIEKEENNELRALMVEKERLQDELNLMEKKDNALKSSMTAFVDEILDELHKSNSALRLDIEVGKREKSSLVKEIDSLKATLVCILETCQNKCYEGKQEMLDQEMERVL